jgi:putative ABC transport system permease protein
MLTRYVKLAFRTANRQKGFSITNILGLAAGMAVCLLIFLVVRFETGFDRFHAKKDHIYRVVSIFKEPQGIDYEPGVPFPTAPALRQDCPQLKNVADILSLGGDGQISVPDSNGSTQLFKEETGVLYSEPQFFGIFDFQWLAGDKATALKEPNTVVLTKTIAEKYFGNWEDAVGDTNAFRYPL